MIVVVSGTGTEVGKTTTSVALLRALRSHGLAVRAWKPVETGGDADGRALAEATGSDAGPTWRLSVPVAANVAARLDGVELSGEDLVTEARRRASGARLLLVETAGGLFSPFTDSSANADWVARLRPDLHVLVAANRLGVLHDVEACRRAAATSGAPVDLVVLTGGSPNDASVATNASEVRRRGQVVAVPAPGEVAALVEWVLARLG